MADKKNYEFHWDPKDMKTKTLGHWEGRTVQVVYQFKRNGSSLPLAETYLPLKHRGKPECFYSEATICECISSLKH
ncbi:unnamed protein product [Dracunculus medinensis]|uniref:Cytotoxic translational repressor of toxin-antitoxin stability system n=1 Tax=Dracunculus medinensis TaxID=318479 RepID=A0A0N4U5Y3_DRAME|nr:unnamed protein product [Dracunculus medinensis]